MTDRYLKRRPTWYRYAIVMGVIVCLFVATQVKSYRTGQPGALPAWSLIFGGALFTFAAVSEMCATVRWNDRSVQMFARWGFNYLGGKTFTVQIGDITSISDGYMSDENVKDLPFTTIAITDGYNAVRIRTDAFYREGMQALIADIARLRPDLELTDNLKAYARGDFDGDWVK
jgi:hypothetical protein